MEIQVLFSLAILQNVNQETLESNISLEVNET